MADFLFVTRKANKTGTFAKPEMTTMPGDICLIYEWPKNPGNGAVWKNGRFGYFKILNQTASFLLKFKQPWYSPIIDSDGEFYIKRKRKFSIPQVKYEILSEDYVKPTLTISLSDFMEAK